MSKFYISKPGGHAITTGTSVARKDVVIEADVEGDHLKIIAPADTAESWPTVAASKFYETTGPARGISPSEYWNIIEVIAPGSKEAHLGPISKER